MTLVPHWSNEEDGNNHEVAYDGTIFRFRVQKPNEEKIYQAVLKGLGLNQDQMSEAFLRLGLTWNQSSASDSKGHFLAKRISDVIICPKPDVMYSFFFWHVNHNKLKERPYIIQDTISYCEVVYGTGVPTVNMVASARLEPI